MIYYFYSTSVKIILLLSFLASVTIRISTASDDSSWSYDELREIAIEQSVKKNYQSALMYFDKAVHIAPNNPEGYINRGGILELLHQSKQAIQDELHAISLANNNSKDSIDFRCTAHQNLAGIYLNNKQFAKAEAEARTALQLCPNDPGAQVTLGNILVKNKNNREAYSQYLKAKTTYEQWQLPGEASKINAKIRQLQQIK